MITYRDVKSAAQAQGNKFAERVVNQMIYLTNANEDDVMVRKGDKPLSNAYIDDFLAAMDEILAQHVKDTAQAEIDAFQLI